MDWKSKIKNKAFWLAIIPAVLLLVQTVLGAFGITWDYTVISKNLIAILNALFVVLAILGIVVDPNTPGITDTVKPEDDAQE